MNIKRKVEKGYSGRLLGSKAQSISRIKQDTGKATTIEEEVDGNTKQLERKKSIKKSFFSLFPDRRSSPHRVTSKPRHWTQDEDQLLRDAVGMFGEKKWKQIAEQVPDRNHTQCLQRWSKVLAPGLKKGQWEKIEDKMLVSLVTAELSVVKVKDGKTKLNWGKISRSIKGRTAKQCRERWVNNLDPEITKAAWTEDEDTLLLMLQERYPKRWAMISKYLPGRTENAVKIRFKSLTRNVNTEAEKDKLRAQISKCTVDEQIAKVKEYCAVRKMKEQESLRSRLIRLGSGMMSSFSKKNSAPYNFQLNSMHDVSTVDLPFVAVDSMNTPVSEFVNNMTNQQYYDMKPTDMFSPNSEFRRSNRNLLSGIVLNGSTQVPSAFQKFDGSFRQKRRASTTTSTVNNTNLVFTDFNDQTSFSHLNLISSVAPPMMIEKSHSDRSLMRELLLPVHDTPKVNSKRNLLLQQHSQPSDRSIDMSECVKLLSANPS